ncbi:MAG: hypothetical protein ACREVR_19980, partial [Burkholderiales bacterium]
MPVGSTQQRDLWRRRDDIRAQVRQPPHAPVDPADDRRFCDRRVGRQSQQTVQAMRLQADDVDASGSAEIGAGERERKGQLFP